MSKLKTGLVLLLTVLLIAALAVLPQAVAGVLDFLGNEKNGTASMQSVELAFDADRVDEPGYMMRKLALEQNMNTIPIAPEQASMTEEEALIAAQDAMAPYLEAHVFEWFEYTFSSAEPYLAVDPGDKNNNSVFWSVAFLHEEKPYHSLFLHIDDETGCILFLTYETNGPDQFNYYYPENQRLMMEGLVDSFLSPLKLTVSQLSEYENLVGCTVAEQKMTDDVTCMVYTYEDAQYGTIRVTFLISPEGLHIYFPSR